MSFYHYYFFISFQFIKLAYTLTLTVNNNVINDYMCIPNGNEYNKML